MVKNMSTDKSSKKYDREKTRRWQAHISLAEFDFTSIEFLPTCSFKTYFVGKHLLFNLKVFKKFLKSQPNKKFKCNLRKDSAAM